MRLNYLLSGLLLIVLSAALYVVYRDFFYLVIMIPGLYLVISGATYVDQEQINRKVESIVYERIVDQGLKRIERGAMKVDRDRFLKDVELMRPILGQRNLMPDVGYDAIVFRCNTESEANELAERIRSRGLQVSTVQSYKEWLVRVEL
ncbi:hypothetical protein [Thermogymnomonas acidicola]|uniref:hypothetical protein n=1 Tax=Thermogymnomonas acidicola TaxID=399579 RepID=UPI0016688A3D|nr:hypothetical protein [Thermogymnomonas acidicola]